MFAITLGGVSSHASKWTRYQNYKIHLDAPEGWQIERDLYGMPIMVLGPERDGERAVLSVQHTPIYGMEFDHKLLVKTKKQYYEGRKNFINSMNNDSKFLSEIPYRHLRWTNGNDGFEMGFRYESRGITLEEKSIQVNCGNRLFLFKTLSSDKLPDADTKTLAKLVNELDCVATTTKDGAYEPSQLQDYERRVKDDLLGVVKWPTRQQIKKASIPAKAVMIEALVQFYKDFESAGGSDFYVYNKDPKEAQFFAKIKDRTDRIFSAFVKNASAASGEFDCFFGGWPSKFIKKNGSMTCGYPWDTNPDYQKVGEGCGEGKLECNPTLFGNDVCIDVNNANERAHATLKCEVQFRATGKSYEDIAKDPSIDQSILYDTVEAAKDVCSVEPYSSSNYGLCSTLKEKLGVSIVANGQTPDESDTQFINGLDEMKPENFDEYVNATVSNYKNFESRCIDEKGELKTDVENCLEDHLAILEDLEKIDKRASDIGQELQEEEQSSSIVNENCSSADCGASGTEIIQDELTTEEVVQSPNLDKNGCTPEQVKFQKENECSWSKGLSMAGGCLGNLFTSIVSSVWKTIKAIGELIWDGVKWVGNKIVQGAKWFAGLFGYEDESSKKITTAAQTSNSAIASFKKDPTGSAVNMIKTIKDGIDDFVSNDLACEKWSAVPHLSTCLIPAKKGCMSCTGTLNAWCSGIGYVAGELIPAFFTGGATIAIKGTAYAAKVTKYLSKMNRLGKLTRLESSFLKTVKKGGDVSKLNSRISKVKNGLNITGKMSKTQKYMGKIYNLSRWPAAKYNKVKMKYIALKKVLKGFKSTHFGGLQKTIAKLKNIRNKNFVFKAGNWVVNATVVKPLKFATKIVSAPVRIPYKWTKKYVGMQGKIYKSGLKYGERRFNKTIVQTANVNKYSTVSKNIALYGSLSKYPVTGSHMLDEFRERASMNDGTSLFWKSTKEIEAQAKAEGKDPEQVKALLKQNRIDQMTYGIVMDSWNLGNEPKEADINHLVKVRGIPVDDLRMESIDARLQTIAGGTTPIFTQADYNALARVQKISPADAQKKIQDEVKLQVASADVIAKLDQGQKPSDEALQNLASVKGVTVDDIVIESINRRIMTAMGGVKPAFSKFDYETWARVNNISYEEAKKIIDAEVLDSISMVTETTGS